MTSEKLKFISSTISKIFNYFNKNVLQARIFVIALSISLIWISSAISLAIVLYFGDMKLIELLEIINKIIK
tara:strand:+ start:399 stop:611 length:213 start_codon:yes stop_codon:yes gene_type:complete